MFLYNKLLNCWEKRKLVLLKQKYSMKKSALSLLLAVITCVLSSFRTIDVDAKIITPTFAEIGYQSDDNYYYTFYADLSKDAPNPIVYIQVQKNNTGEVLKLDDFKGKVHYWKATQFTIKDTATVSFFDGSKLISKDLVGLIKGGVKP
jgi:hypothetical protein